MGEYTHLGPPGTGLAKRERGEGLGGKTKKTNVGSSYRNKETASANRHSTRIENLAFNCSARLVLKYILASDTGGGLASLGAWAIFQPFFFSF